MLLLAALPADARPSCRYTKLRQRSGVVARGHAAGPFVRRAAALQRWTIYACRPSGGGGAAVSTRRLCAVTLARARDAGGAERDTTELFRPAGPVLAGAHTWQVLRDAHLQITGAGAEASSAARGAKPKPVRAIGHNRTPSDAVGHGRYDRTSPDPPVVGRSGPDAGDTLRSEGIQGAVRRDLDQVISPMQSPMPH